MNRDTLYSSGVYDLEAGPVTVQMPGNEDGRFQSLAALSVTGKPAKRQLANPGAAADCRVKNKNPGAKAGVLSLYIKVIRE